MISIQYGDLQFDLTLPPDPATFTARHVLDALFVGEDEALKHAYKSFSLILVAADLAYERIVEDFETRESFFDLVQSGLYALRLQEDPSKYEFLRRPQMIFGSEDEVQLSGKFCTHGSIEANLEAYFRDPTALDFRESDRVLQLQSDLKWCVCQPSGGSGSNVNIARMNNLLSCKWKTAHFCLKGHAQLGAVLMYSASAADQIQNSAVNSFVFAVLQQFDLFYSVSNKKKLGGHLILFQPSRTDPGSSITGQEGVKCLLLKSRAHLNRWLSALRLAKYGEALRLAYHRAAPMAKPRCLFTVSTSGHKHQLHGGPGDLVYESGLPVSSACCMSQSKAKCKPPLALLQDKMRQSLHIPSLRSSLAAAAASGGQMANAAISRTAAVKSHQQQPCQEAVKPCSRAAATHSSSSSNSSWSLSSASSTSTAATTSSKDESLEMKPILQPLQGPIEEEAVFIPMEFGRLGESRILTDPEEIRDLHVYESERYFRRKYGRLIDQAWFWNRSLECLEEYLSHHGCIDGFFAVRMNMSPNMNELSNFPFILTFTHQEKVQHRKIQQGHRLHESIFALHQSPFLFRDVSSLIDFFRLNKTAYLPCLLTEHPHYRAAHYHPSCRQPHGDPQPPPGKS